MNLYNRPDNRINQYILWEIVICVIVILATMIKQSGIASLFFAVAFVIIPWHMMHEFKCGIKSLGCYALILVFLSVAMTCLGAIVNNVSISFDYFVYGIVFASTILVLCTAVNARVNVQTASFILKANLLISFLFPLAYFFFPHEITSAGLTLNFSNQNLLAIWLMLYILYACLSFIALQSVWKVLSVLSFGTNLYLIFLTQSRNTLLSILLFAVLLFVVRYKKNVKFPRWFLLTLILLPLIFIPIYLWLIQPAVEKGWFDFMISEGKPLTSRVFIWERCFILLEDHWLTGYYAMPMMRGNMHNMYMVVLCSYGAPMLVAVITYLYKIVQHANDNASNAFQNYALCAFFAVLFMGIAEGALFSGGLNLSIPAGGFLYLANSDFSIQITEKEKVPKRIYKYLKM